MPRTATAAATAEFTKANGGQWLPIVAVYWSGTPTYYAAEAFRRPERVQARLVELSEVEELVGWEKPVDGGNVSFSLQDADGTISTTVSNLSRPGIFGQRIQVLLWSRSLTNWSDALAVFDGELETVTHDAANRLWSFSCRSKERALDTELLPLVDKATFPKLGCPGENTSHIPLVYGNPCYRVPAVLIGRPGMARLSTDLQLWQENLYIDRDAADGGFSLNGETTLAVGYPGNYELITGGWVGTDDDDTDAEDFEARTRFVIRSRTRWWASGDELAAGRGFGSDVYSRVYFAAVPTDDLPATDAADILGRAVYFRDDYENARLQNGAAIVWRPLLSTLSVVRDEYTVLGYTRPDYVRQHWRYKYVISAVKGIDPVWPAGTPVMLVQPSTLTSPFSTESGSLVVTVQWERHGLAAGDVVRFAGANTVGGVNFNGVWTVGTVLNDDQFQLVLSTPATGTGTGGGTVTYWTRPEAGNNGYWKYAVNAVPSNAVVRVEARGSSAPPGGGTTEPVWYTMNPDEYDVQLDDKSHNADLGREDDDPGLTTISLARPLTAYGGIDPAPFVTLNGPATVETVDESDPDDVIVAEKPGDVFRHLLTTDVVSGVTTDDWNDDSITDLQDALDADTSRQILLLSFAILEQSKLVETLKALAVQATANCRLDGTEIRFDAVDAFAGLSADDSTASPSTLRSWSEKENERPPSVIHGAVKLYTAGDPLPVVTRSPGIENAYGLSEHDSEWIAYQSLVRARAAQEFWHQHMADRQRVVELYRFGDVVLSTPTDAIGGTGIESPLPGQLRKQRAQLTRPEVQQTVDSRVWDWDDIDAVETSDDRCLEPPSVLPNLQPQGWVIQRGQGETPDLSYSTPLKEESCYCQVCTKGLAVTISGMPDQIDEQTSLGITTRWNPSDANGEWLLDCVTFSTPPYGYLPGGDSPNVIDIPTGPDSGTFLRLGFSHQFQSRFEVELINTQRSTESLGNLVFWYPDYSQRQGLCANGEYATWRRTTAHGYTAATFGVEVLGCCSHADLPDELQRFEVDFSGYTPGRFNNNAPIQCRLGGTDLQAYTNGGDELTVPPTMGAPSAWLGCVVRAETTSFGATPNVWPAMAFALGESDEKFYLLIGPSGGGWATQSHLSYRDIIAVYEAAADTEWEVDTAVSMTLVYRAPTSNPYDDTGGTYPAALDVTPRRCRTVLDVADDQR